MVRLAGGCGSARAGERARRRLVGRTRISAGILAGHRSGSVTSTNGPAAHRLDPAVDLQRIADLDQVQVRRRPRPASISRPVAVPSSRVTIEPSTWVTMPLTCDQPAGHRARGRAGRPTGMPLGADAGAALPEPLPAAPAEFRSSGPPPLDPHRLGLDAGRAGPNDRSPSDRGSIAKRWSIAVG